MPIQQRAQWPTSVPVYEKEMYWIEGSIPFYSTKNWVYGLAAEVPEWSGKNGVTVLIPT